MVRIVRTAHVRQMRDIHKQNNLSSETNWSSNESSSYFSPGRLCWPHMICCSGCMNPPGVALAMYPLLLHPGHWFPLSVVLPFTVIATGSAALSASRRKAESDIAQSGYPPSLPEWRTSTRSTSTPRCSTGTWFPMSGQFGSKHRMGIVSPIRKTCSSHLSVLIGSST
jgi:hypothetical protein